MRYTTLLALFFVAGVLALPTNEPETPTDDQNAKTDDIDLPEAEEAQKISTPKKEFKKDVAMQADNPEPDMDLKSQTLKDGANTVQALVSFDSSSVSEFRTTIGMEMRNKRLYLSLSRSPNVNQLHLSVNGKGYRDLDSTRLDISNLDNGSSIYINLYYNSTAHDICASYQRLWEEEELHPIGNCVPVLKTQSGAESGAESGPETETESGAGNMTAFYGYHGGVNPTNLYKATTGLFLDAIVSSAEDEDAGGSTGGHGSPKQDPDYLPEDIDTITQDILIWPDTPSSFYTSISLQKGKSIATLSVSRSYNAPQLDILFDNQKQPLSVSKLGYFQIYLHYETEDQFCASWAAGGKKNELGCVHTSPHDFGPVKMSYYHEGVIYTSDPSSENAYTTVVKVPDGNGLYSLANGHE
ncbi:hypothetical protein RI367_002424 [Sorochytrium milnesiophthora]